MEMKLETRHGNGSITYGGGLYASGGAQTFLSNVTFSANWVHMQYGGGTGSAHGGTTEHVRHGGFVLRRHGRPPDCTVPVLRESRSVPGSIMHRTRTGHGPRG